MTSPSINTSTYVFSVDRHGRHDNNQIIADVGHLHYDPNTAAVKMGNAFTPGGLPLGGSLDDIDLSLYYSKGEIDNTFQNIIGTATSAGNTLGKLETSLTTINTNITNLQNTINSRPPDTDVQTLSLDTSTKDLSIVRGNTLNLTIPSKQPQSLIIDFPYTYYYAQSSAPWFASYGYQKSLLSNRVVVKADPSIYTGSTWGLNQGLIRLDSKRTYKITFMVSKHHLTTTGLNGNTWSNTQMVPNFIVFGDTQNNNSYILGSVYDNTTNLPQLESGSYGPSYRATSYGYSIIYNHSKSYIYTYSGSPAYFYPFMLVYGDKSFYCEARLVITSLD